MNRATLIVTWVEVWDSYWRQYLGQAGRVAQLIERLSTRLTPHTVAISALTGRDLKSLRPSIEPEVIPCGVDVAHIRSLTERADTVDLLFVGRLIREKNVDLLIRALAELKARQRRLSCLIVGNGPEKEALRGLVERLELTDQVRFQSFFHQHDDLFAQMKAARVVVNPSSREGFGIITVEANACGRPVITIASPRNASRDLIEPGRNGFVCEPNEVALAETIETTLTGSACSTDDCIAVAERYDWDRITDQVEAYYSTRLAS